MDSAYATNIFIIGCLAIPTVLIGYRAIVAGRELKIRNKRAIDEAFKAATSVDGMANAVILKDYIRLGRKGKGDKPFEVYRVLHVPPNSWFAYTHVQGTGPVLTPISETRAQAAVAS